MKPGQILNSMYCCDFEITSGGTRTRFIGTNLDTKKQVIIEAISDAFTHDETAIAGLQYEIELSQKLSHKCFMKYIDSFVFEGSMYIIWDYVDAVSATKNASLKKLSDKNICTFIADLVDGIAFAHSQDLIHGALSTDVILVTTEISPIITGFPIPGSPISTDPGSIEGLSAYKAAAPELYYGEPLDKSCDFYAIGAIARFLFSLANDYRQQLLANVSHGLSYNDERSSHAKGLIELLISPNRGLRIESANRILDPSFLDSMITPAQGIEKLEISKRDLKRIKSSQPDYYKVRMQIIFWLRAAIASGIALAILYFISQLLENS